MLKSRFEVNKALLLSFSLLCIIFLQGCTDNLNNNNQGFFYSGSCPIKSAPTLTDNSLCIGIYDCQSEFCSAGSDSGIQVVIGHRNENISQLQCNRRLANLSLHSCSFGTNTEAEIKSLEVVREEDGNNFILLSMAEGAIIEPEEEESDDDSEEDDDGNDEDDGNNDDNDGTNDKGIRLVSFYSLRCGNINQNSLLTSGSLYRARLDEDKGSVVISDSNIVCGKVDETPEATLKCTYNVNAGCVYTLSLWGYDSRNNFSNRKTIEIR